jgi:hypothetical protein
VKKFMEAKIPSKQATLIWRILNQALPVKDKLVSKGIRCSPICPRCNNAVETTNHVFMHCECAKAVLFGSIYQLPKCLPGAIIL